MSQQIPHDSTLDATFALWNEGYEFIWNRCKRLQTDMFVTRLLGRTAICIHGRDAAALFYDESKFRRQGAIPRRVVNSLFGTRGVQSLDDEAHRHRKAAFLAVTDQASLERLMEHMAREWRAAITRWERAKRVVLFDEAQRILTRAACDWAGVPLEPPELDERARDFGLMVDAFGGMGPRLWKGKAARSRTERWITRVIGDVRAGLLQVPASSPLHVMAHHTELDGALLTPEDAAVELINVIRPTVALSWYITFAALALREQPHARERIAREPVGEGAGAYATLFMHEVRRHYPFTPYLVAKVRAPFEWRGQQFRTGVRVLLDVYGNSHDPALWDHPDEFRPERFRTWRYDPFSFIPQGGADPRTGHRCPGEMIVMHGLALALHFLTRGITYRVPRQNLQYNLRRMPTRPKSGFVMRDVRSTPAVDAPAPRLPSQPVRAPRSEPFAPALSLL